MNGDGEPNSRSSLLIAIRQSEWGMLLPRDCTPEMADYILARHSRLCALHVDWNLKEMLRIAQKTFLGWSRSEERLMVQDGFDAYENCLLK